MHGQLSNHGNISMSRLWEGVAEHSQGYLTASFEQLASSPSVNFQSATSAAHAARHLEEFVNCHLPWVPQDCSLLLQPLTDTTTRTVRGGVLQLIVNYINWQDSQLNHHRARCKLGLLLSIAGMPLSLGKGVTTEVSHLTHTVGHHFDIIYARTAYWFQYGLSTLAGFIPGSHYFVCLKRCIQLTQAPKSKTWKQGIWSTLKVGSSV